MWMEVHIHSVKARRQVDDIWEHEKSKPKRKADWDLINLHILLENSAEDLGSRRKHC